MDTDGKQPPLNASQIPPIPVGYWTSDRQEIGAWLAEQSPSLAELYETAVILMLGTPLPSRVRVVCHCIREVCNRLITVTVGKKEGGNLDYVQRVTQISVLWQKHGLGSGEAFAIDFNLDSSEPSRLPTFNIPSEIVFELANLIQVHDETSSTLEERAISFFAEHVFEETTLLVRQTLITTASEWKKLTRWFVKMAHDNGDVNADCSEEELQARFAQFESFLSAISRSFYSTTNELDKILEETNA